MRRNRASTRARQSVDAETLVKMARRLSESGSRLEDQLWQRRLIETINDRLARRSDDAIESALDDLARTSQRAYDDLADLAESCAESTQVRDRRQGPRRAAARDAVARVVALQAAGDDAVVERARQSAHSIERPPGGTSGARRRGRLSLCDRPATGSLQRRASSDRATRRCRGRIDRPARRSEEAA